MSTLKFTGIAQARKRNTPYDIAIENHVIPSDYTEEQYENFIHGVNVAQVTLYKRADASETPNTYYEDGGVDVTYTFETGTVTFAGNPPPETSAGWHKHTYHDDQHPDYALYVIYASANSKNETDVIAPKEWTQPVILSEAGTAGADGRNVAFLYLYQSNGSKTNPPTVPADDVVTFNFATKSFGNTGNWRTTPPSSDNIWVTTAIASDSESSTAIRGWSTPSLWKEKGDTGVGVSSVQYGKSNSESTVPSDFSPTMPTLSEGDWLWVKTNYTDNTFSFTKSYVGTDGDDGISVYVKSATKVGKTTTVVLEDTAGSTTTMTIVDGDDGEQGIPGLNGYIHYAWANDNHGTDFSTSVSDGKSWMGVYEDQGSTRPADSQDYRSYSWTEIKGPQGIQGETGPRGPQGETGPQGQTGAAGADAQVFDFKMSSQIFVMNLRLTGYSQIDLESIVQGYQGVNILWTVTGGTFDPTSTTPVRTSTATSPSLFIPYTTSANITITLKDTTSGSTIEPVVKTLTVNDETSYGHNYGLLASEPTIASSPRLIYAPDKPADFYTNSTNGITYEYTMVDQTITWKASADAAKLLDGLALIKKADPPIDLNDPAYSDSNGVALFTTILAERVIARVIKALQLEIGTENSGLYVHIAESNGNKIFIVKYNGTPIFTIDSEGKTSMVRATMDNASLTGNGSSFFSDVFKTTRANSSSGTVNKDYTSLDWYYKLETSSDDSLAYAFWNYVVTNGTEQSIFRPGGIRTFRVLKASGYYNGTAISLICADPDIPRGIGYAVIGTLENNTLWLEYNTARTTIVNQNIASYISGVSIDKANYKQGWLLTSSFISSLNLPYNFSMKVTGGYATVNNGSQTFYSGSTLTLTSSSITLSGSGNPVTLTAGTYVQPFGFYGMTVETSRDGIATKHIASYDGNTYDVGTTDKPFNFYGYVNGNASSGKSNPNNFKVWGAVFN